MRRYKRASLLLISTIAALTLTGGGTAEAQCQFQAVPLPGNAGLVAVSVCVNESSSYANKTQRGSSTELISVGVLGAGQGALVGVNGGGEQSTVTYKRSGKTIRITTISYAGNVAPPGNNTIGTTGASYKLGATQTETKTGSRTDQVTTAGGDFFVGQALLPAGGVRLGFEVREDRKGGTCTQRVVVKVLAAGVSQSVGQPVPCAAQAPRLPDFPKP